MACITPSRRTRSRSIRINAVKRTRPRTLKTVDPRAVVNSDQARRLLAAVAGTGPRGERMVAFYGCMYYAALRPEEAVDLRRDNLLDLPDYGWGEMILTHSEPRSGTSWTDTGLARQRRELKHRAPGETRTVPSGQQDEAKRRILNATRPTDTID